MELDGATLLAGFAASGVGFVLMRYGKKMSRPPQLVVGILLMIFPYFLPSALLVLATSAALLGLLWLAVRQGW